MTDEDIQRGIDADPDARNTDAAFWRNARLVEPIRKRPITIRLDSDLLSWFRRHKGYQTEINSILRAYMRAKRRQDRSRRAPRPRHRMPAAAE